MQDACKVTSSRGAFVECGTLPDEMIGSLRRRHLIDSLGANRSTPFAGCNCLASAVAAAAEYMAYNRCASLSDR